MLKKKREDFYKILFNGLISGKVKPSVVDDQFFKLNELEQFLQNEEKHLDKPEKEHHTLDLFDKMVGAENQFLIFKPSFF